MSDSILETVKKNLATDSYFEPDLIMHINGAFATLQQMGVGPAEGYQIEDASNTWDEFSTDTMIVNLTKPYIVAKVKLGFDVSTASSYMIQLLKDQVAEAEWRLNVAVDPKTTFKMGD